MTRVWLTEWEWACCGDPFRVGDEVDFGIETRSPLDALPETLGAGLGAMVDAIESHHVEEYPDRVRGRVSAIRGVTLESIERRSLRRPGHGAPPDATMPPDGEEWPMTGRDLGDGWFIGSRPSRFVVESTGVPGSAVLVSVLGIRLPDPEADDPAGAADPAWRTADEADGSDASWPDDAPHERRTRQLVGWLVDVEER